jgi:hypothetical protein
MRSFLQQSFWKNSVFKVGIVLLAIAIIGLSTVGQYGISYDEEGPLRVAFETLQTVKTGKPYAGHLQHYGTLFNVTSEVLFQKKIRLFGTNFPQQDRFVGVGYTIAPFYERIKLKHVLTFLLSLVTYGAVAGLVGIWAGMEYAWLGSITLALFPRFWGHSFVNPKDIPLAAVMALGTFLGVYLIGYFHRMAGKDLRLGINRTTLYALGYGVLMGLIAGVRLDGSVVLVFTAIAHCVTSVAEYRKEGLSRAVPGNRPLNPPQMGDFEEPGSSRIVGIETRTRISLREATLLWLQRFWQHYGLMLGAWATTTLLVYPPAWKNPWTWFWETLQFYYREDWPLTVLFKGQFLSAEKLPWFYLPQWWSITIPEIFQITFSLGIIGLIWHYKTMTVTQRAGVVMVLLQIFFLPILVVLLHSTLYDEARQFLYVIPGVAAIATTTLIWIYKTLSPRVLRIFALAVAIALLSPIAFDMIALHPYQYVYFNRSFGGLANAYGRYETDYWGLSLREGMDWINQTVPPQSTIVSSEPFYASAPIARDDLTLIPVDQYEPLKVAKPFYYIAIPRWDFQQQFPQCEVVYQVQRQGIPLTQIKQCR